MKENKLLKIALCSNKIDLGNTKNNGKEIVRLIESALAKDAEFILFPKDAITGHSLFEVKKQDFIYRKQLNEINNIADYTKDKKITLLLGGYLRINGNFIDSTFILEDGEVKTIIPKELPKEIETLDFDESIIKTKHEIKGKSCCLTAMMNESLEKLELEDINLLVVLNSKPYRVGNSQLEDKLEEISIKNQIPVLLTSVHSTDSTSFDLHQGLIQSYEHGEKKIDNRNFSLESKIEFLEIELKKPTKEGSSKMENTNMISYSEESQKLLNKTPFIPMDKDLSRKRALELFSAQSYSVAIRMKKAKAKKIILGVSGGLDSTLALLVAYNAFQILKRDPKDIIGISMPGLGTSETTYNSSMGLIEKLGITKREINITQAVKQHFKDIDYDESDFGTCYENAQARERTQILMDVSNKENGIVLGTGDMSEIALGWCTYNGDQMAMYGANSNIVKTLIPEILNSVNEYHEAFKAVDLKPIIQGIIDTPISPELLPTDEDGNIAQKTEDNIGPYIAHDFFLYHTLRYGTEPEALYMLACHVFREDYDKKDIRKWLITFYRRFFTQRFKTNASPEYAVLGNINLAFKLPSDIDPNLWIQEIEE